MKRTLGFWRTWGLVVGVMIGNGILLLPALLAPYGNLSLLGWIFAGGGTLFIAMMLGSLARRMPKIGGPYAYTRAAFGDLTGFLIGWGYWLSLCLATAAGGVAFAGYFGVFIPSISSEAIPGAMTALLVIWIFTGICVSGMKSAGTVQLITTLLKLLPLFLIAGAGMLLGDVTSVSTSNPTDESFFVMVASMITITMWAFVGVEAATIPADDVIQPEKTIPKALLVGTLTVTGVYILATYGVMALIPGPELAVSTSPFADAAKVVFGPWGSTLVAIGALISIVGGLNGNILLSGMTLRAVALDRLFPARFASTNKAGAPAFALIFTGLLASLLVAMNYLDGLVSAYKTLIILSTLTSVLPYASSSVADLVLQKRAAPSEGWRWKSVLVATGALAFSIFVIFGAGLKDASLGLILLAAGLPIYYWLKRKSANSSSE
ncbi:MAG: amino acid permease [Bacteroidetes bacterium]|nr:amino acid permease [Bacteroidota bacterium]